MGRATGDGPRAELAGCAGAVLHGRGRRSLLAPDRAERAAHLECLEEVPDIRDLTRLLERPEERSAPRFAEVERQGVPLETSWVP